MANDRDQEIVKSAIADTSAGLLEFLSALGQREAIAFGDGVTLPVRITFDELPAHAMPRSSSARFTEMWQKSVGDEGFLDCIVDRWRNASASADAVQGASMFAESVNLPAQAAELPAPAVCEDRHTRARDGHGERRNFALRREPSAAAPAKTVGAVRSMREKLQQP
jgi:hypothetical protein